MRTLLDYLGYLHIGPKDVIEVLLVGYLFYRILLLWTGTRALQILFGLVLLVAIHAVARLLDLSLITYLLSQAFTYGAFALIVVFQPELRNALAQLGRSRVWRFFSRMEESEVAGEIADAAARLARARIGGLIAIEREVGLGEYADTGTHVGADVSAELLSTIFTPYSPLHDGAVIVRGDQIVAAGCILPLTQFPVEDRSLGTRHRAALGLSEETDAYVVVISEETSQISLAHRGQLTRDLSPDQLRVRLALGEQPELPVPHGSRGGESAGTEPDATGEGLPLPAGES
jgi:diadenylate cyclase